MGISKIIIFREATKNLMRSIGSRSPAKRQHDSIGAKKEALAGEFFPQWTVGVIRLTSICL